jgi:hypothetical protein
VLAALAVSQIAFRKVVLFSRGVAADFRKMVEQISWMLVHAIGSRLLKFGLPISAREQPDPECLGSAGSQQVPDAVPDDDAIAECDSEPPRSREKEIGSGLA